MAKGFAGSAVQPWTGTPVASKKAMGGRKKGKMGTSLRSERLWFIVAIIAAALGGIAVIAAIAAPADSDELPGRAAPPAAVSGAVPAPASGLAPAR